jgi:hypothetical protein
MAEKESDKRPIPRITAETIVIPCFVFSILSLSGKKSIRRNQETHAKKQEPLL